MNKELFAIVIAVFAAQIGSGQSFPSSTISLPTRSSCLGCFSETPVPIQPGDFLFLQRAVPSDGGQNGFQIHDLGGLALNSFASSTDINNLRSTLDASRVSVNSEIRNMKFKLSRGVALASATDLQSPAPGKLNRVGGMITAYNGQVAGALNYVHQAGRVDLGAALGIAHGGTLGKAGAGFSW